MAGNISQEVLLMEGDPAVAGEWSEVALGDFAPFIYGKGLRIKERNPSGNVPVFGSNGIVGYHDFALTDGPTIIIGRKGTVGAVHYSSIPCWPIDTTFFITDKDPVLLRFKYYSLKTLPLKQMNSDSAVPGLNRNEAHGCVLRVPPLPEQRAIAEILGVLDDKIELNRRMNRTLEAMARAIFKDWFVDFGPTRAKMAGREPYLSPDLWDISPDRLSDSELGEAPEGWDVKVLGDELEELVSGQRPRGGAVKAGVPSIGAENVIGLGRYDFCKEKYIPFDFFDRLKTRGADVRDGDVLLYKDGAQIGRKTYFDRGFPHDECAVNEHVFILRLRNPEAQRYLFFWLDQRRLTQEIIALNSNSAQPGINRTGVRSLPFILPPDEILSAFDNMISPLTDQIFANRHESRTLVAQRDTLLPKLASGELRVKIEEEIPWTQTTGKNISQ